MRPRVFFSEASVCLLLLALLASPVIGETVCLSVREERQVAVVPAAIGSELRLSFLHSIYGSQVEEQFEIARSGFQIVRLRYAEQRLAEFYGHEAARLEEGWWIIEGPGRGIPMLDLRVSPESSIRVTLNGQSILPRGEAEPEGHLRVAVTECAGGNGGR